jgi:hypothetical protein
MIGPFRKLGGNSQKFWISFSMKNYSATLGNGFLDTEKRAKGIKSKNSIDRFSGIGIDKKAPRVYQSSEPIVSSAKNHGPLLNYGVEPKYSESDATKMTQAFLQSRDDGRDCRPISYSLEFIIEFDRRVRNFFVKNELSAESQFSEEFSTKFSTYLNEYTKGNDSKKQRIIKDLSTVLKEELEALKAK